MSHMNTCQSLRFANHPQTSQVGMQDYGALGSWQQQHLAKRPYLADLAAQIVESACQDHAHMFSGNVNHQFAEMRAPILLLAMLLRM